MVAAWVQLALLVGVSHVDHAISAELWVILLWIAPSGVLFSSQFRQHHEFQVLVIQVTIGISAKALFQPLRVYFLGFQEVVANLVPLSLLSRLHPAKGIVMVVGSVVISVDIFPSRHPLDSRIDRFL